MNKQLNIKNIKSLYEKAFDDVMLDIIVTYNSDGYLLSISKNVATSIVYYCYVMIYVDYNEESINCYKDFMKLFKNSHYDVDEIKELLTKNFRLPDYPYYIDNTDNSFMTISNNKKY